MAFIESKRFTPIATTVLRVIVGITFLLMGIPKVQNPAGFIGFVTSLDFPAPEIIGWIPIVLEPLGGLLLILGIGTRVVSFFFLIEMIITAFYVKAYHGTPFIQASGKAGTGFELDVLLLGAALMLVVVGSGALSLQRMILRRGT